MKAVILYDSRSPGGATDALIDAIGLKLLDAGVYVEKARCKAKADYSFVREFDIVILGAPVYYFFVASQLLGAFIQGNLKASLRKKNIALFLTCGSPDAMATVLYLPQLKVHLIRNRILAEKIFAPGDIADDDVVDSFVEEILHEYSKTGRHRAAPMSAKWTREAEDWLQTMPSFLQGKFKGMAEKYAEDMGCEEITLDMLMDARNRLGGT
ncbi:MAG: protochlorophyllide oxidoreductase [Chlorobiaceae bacterium]